MRRSPLSIVQITTAAVVACAMAFPASADLLVYTGFDYGEATTLQNASSSNDIGWAGTWSNHTTISLDSSGSLAYPAGVNLPSQPGMIDNPGGSTNTTNFRYFDTSAQIDQSTAGTWYMSFLAAANYAFEIRLRSGTGSVQWNVGQGGSTRASRLFGPPSGAGDLTTNNNVSVLNGEVYFYVFKLETDGLGGANGYLSQYQVGEDTVGSEPAVWDLERTGATTTATIDNILITSNSAASIFMFDELRIGTTWASVTIPEPASLALLGLGGLMMFRRSSRQS